MSGQPPARSRSARLFLSLAWGAVAGLLAFLPCFFAFTQQPLIADGLARSGLFPLPPSPFTGRLPEHIRQPLVRMMGMIALCGPFVIAGLGTTGLFKWWVAPALGGLLGGLLMGTKVFIVDHHPGPGTAAEGTVFGTYWVAAGLFGSLIGAGRRRWSRSSEPAV